MHVQGDFQINLKYSVIGDLQGHDNWVRSTVHTCLLPPRHSLGPSWPCPSCSIMSLLDLAGDSAEILLQGLLISNPHINLSFQ